MFTNKEQVHLILFEVNQNTPLPVREKLTFHSSEFSEPAEHLRKIHGYLESVLICTCNRTSLLCLVQGENIIIKKEIIKLFINWAGTEEVSKYIQIYNDATAIIYFVELGIGNRSIIIGEPQILGQIGLYYSASKTASMTGKYLNWLLPRIISESRTIRRKFSLGEGSLSLAGLTANTIIEFLNKYQIEYGKLLIVGWGEVTATIVRIIKGKASRLHIVVANRSPEKVTDHLVEIMSLEVIKEEVNKYDAVVTMMGKVKSFLVSPADFPTHKARILIDLGVPRNIDPSVIKIPEAMYYCIDSFQNEARVNNIKREERIIRTQSEVVTRAERIWGLLQKRYSEQHIYSEVAEISDIVFEEMIGLTGMDDPIEIRKLRSFVVKYIYKTTLPPSSRWTRTADNSIR